LVKLLVVLWFVLFRGTGTGFTGKQFYRRDPLAAAAGRRLAALVVCPDRIPRFSKTSLTYRKASRETDVHESGLHAGEDA